MSAVSASAAPSQWEFVDKVVVDAEPVRKQRVRVPIRLVCSPHYQDIALLVYMKIAALASRPEGCQAKTSTIASYLGMSPASVERGLMQLRRPGPDGVVEIRTKRRTLPGGRGQSALRTVRQMTHREAFVWLPVAAAEDLSPRQFRAYALMVIAQQRGIALTEAELAGELRHHTGKKAGQTISVTAAGVIVDELEATRWVTVQRRAGAQGRHRYIAFDMAPAPTPAAPGLLQQQPETAVEKVVSETGRSQVGEGSGSPVDNGSLANEESPSTDSPEDGRALFSPAVGEIPVRKGAAAVENPAVQTTNPDASGSFALRADGISEPSTKPEDKECSNRGRGAAQSSYTGPPLSVSAKIYAVLEPVHVLLERVASDFVARKIAREVGRQLRGGMTPERLHHRLTTRFASVMLSDIRDPGRWLLGVALPRWGCGHLDCESGTMWSTGHRCHICAEVVADRAAARKQAQHTAQGLCLEPAARHCPADTCQDCEVDEVIRHPVPISSVHELEGPQRDSCGECGARIFLTGRALEDRLCKLCREEAAAPASAAASVSAGPATCSGMNGNASCGRPALPSRSVCARHRIQELAEEVAC